MLDGDAHRPAARPKFRVENRDTAHGACKLIPTDSYDMDATNPAVVSPEEPVHQVLNLPELSASDQHSHLFLSVCELRGVFDGASRMLMYRSIIRASMEGYRPTKLM